MSKKIAILYRRFSSQKQERGDSLRRQSALAEKWCKDNDADLYDVGTDSGVSAYHGKHAAIGALSNVIAAIDSGAVPGGAYLLIENVDRLGRDLINDAYLRLSGILSRNVSIVTLMDGRVFTKQSLNNLGDMMLLIVSMARANEESETKHIRSVCAWEAKAKLISNGQKPRIQCPRWLEYDDSTGGYKLNEHAETIERVFNLYHELQSMSAVARQLNDEGVLTPKKSSKWTQTTVRFILMSKSAFGTLETEKLYADGFYPPIISKEFYYKTQSIIQKRQYSYKSRKNSDVSNILRGIPICGVCGEKMYLHGEKKKNRQGQTRDYRYFSCKTHKVRSTACGLPSFRYPRIESVMIFAMAMIRNLPDLGYNSQAKNSYQERIKAKELEIKELESKFDEMSSLGLSSSRAKQNIKRVDSQITIAQSELTELYGEAETASYNTDTKSFVKTLENVVCKMKTNSEYRFDFAMMLRRIISEFVFCKDGSLKITALGYNMSISGTKGCVNISTDCGVNRNINIK